jgi:hypothetical protein
MTIFASNPSLGLCRPGFASRPGTTAEFVARGLPFPCELIRRQRDLVVDQGIQRRLHVDLGVDDAGLLQREAGG